MHYHVSYDDVPTHEAIDLIRTLPQGSLYVSAIHPEFSWTREREWLADVQDTIYEVNNCVYAGTDERYKVTRPRDLVATKNAKLSAKKTKDLLNNTKWKEA